MRFLFLVQGEGRGHMTQALSFAEMLAANGHELVAVGIGKSKRRQIPDFFLQGINCPIERFESPNFVCDKEQKKILIAKTIIYNLKKSRTYWKSIQTIQKLIDQHKPDVILNFYELLGGLHHLIFWPRQRYWVIGHQYLLAHEDFPFTKKQPIQKLLFQLNTSITAIGAEKWLALSFRRMKKSKNKKLIVLPPLLRSQLFELTPTSGDFILAYMVNAGYATELIEQAKHFPHVKIEAFWDSKAYPSPYQALPNLIFHQINDQLFLKKMSECLAYITTAGFESICEAMYLGKPVLMIPVAGQYEQACNAIDAELAGAGISNHTFDLEKLTILLEKGGRKHHAHPHTWISNSRDIIYKNLFPSTKVMC